MRSVVETRASDDPAAAARDALADGAEEVVIVTDGAVAIATLRDLRALTRVRLRATVASFDAEVHDQLGLPGSPRELLRTLARGAAIGIPVDVVLPVAEELAPVAGRIHGLARAAPKLGRYLLDLVPDGLTARAPGEIAREIALAEAAAAELGVSLSTDDDTRIDTELQAVLAGIKPVMRLSTSREESEGEAMLRARYARFGLVAAAGDGLFIDDDGDHERKLRLVYVARTMAIAEHVRAVEAKTFAPKVSVQARAAEYHELGIALGYPRCCVDAYVERVALSPSLAPSEALSEAYLVARGAYVPSPSWKLNHLLFECGSALVTFTPCGYRCPAALSYANAVLAHVDAEAPLAAARLRRRLTHEVAVDREGARVLVGRDAAGAILRATPRRAPNGTFVHALDLAFARRLLSGPSGTPEEPAPIFLDFRADRDGGS